MSRFEPSAMDVEHLRVIREGVEHLLARAAEICNREPGRVLDIAPQDWAGIAPRLGPACTVETLDIDPAAGATHTGDICATNAHIPAAHYTYIVCTEVLEHTLAPWRAVDELARLLASGGRLFLSVPFNFRIHGPLPDCWRFSEHGLRALFHETDWAIETLEGTETPERPLMPIQYRLVARRL